MVQQDFVLAKSFSQAKKDSSTPTCSTEKFLHCNVLPSSSANRSTITDFYYFFITVLKLFKMSFLQRGFHAIGLRELNNSWLTNAKEKISTAEQSMNPGEEVCYVVYIKQAGF